MPMFTLCISATDIYVFLFTHIGAVGYVRRPALNSNIEKNRIVYPILTESLYRWRPTLKCPLKCGGWEWTAQERDAPLNTVVLDIPDCQAWQRGGAPPSVTPIMWFVMIRATRELDISWGEPRTAGCCFDVVLIEGDGERERERERERNGER